jgi:hypothetical protein
LCDEPAGGEGTYMEPLSQRVRRDGALVMLPVQHVLGAGAVEQVLLTRFLVDLALARFPFSGPGCRG